MDAAISEDLKNLKDPDVPSCKLITASLDFFRLRLNKFDIKELPPPHLELCNIVEKTLEKFNHDSRCKISISLFHEKFVEDLLYLGAKGRSPLTALYTFLSEYVEKGQQLTFRSNIGGSIQPFLDHLFDGARFLESLLEERGRKGNDLLAKIKSPKAKSLVVNPKVLKGGKKLEDAEKEYLKLKKEGKPFQDCNFASAYIIRNTTGHSLLWQDKFTPDSYKTLYNTLVNSIFWTIEKLWINKECEGS